MNATAARAQAPWHLWAVGIVSLLWDGFGGYDYTMSVSHDAAYLSNFPPEVVALLDTYHTWAVCAWAVGVWASLLGAVLLLVRSRHAATAFLVSFVGALVSFVYQMTLDLPASLGVMQARVLPAVIVIVILAQWYYARRMTAAGVLR